MESITVEPKSGWREIFTLTDDCVIQEASGKDLKLRVPYLTLSPNFIQCTQKTDYEFSKSIPFMCLAGLVAYYAYQDMPLLWLAVIFCLLPVYFLIRSRFEKKRRDILFHEAIDGAVGLQIRFAQEQESEVVAFAKEITNRILISQETRNSNKTR